jgi:hypothetical protein
MNRRRPEARAAAGSMDAGASSSELSVSASSVCLPSISSAAVSAGATPSATHTGAADPNFSPDCVGARYQQSGCGARRRGSDFGDLRSRRRAEPLTWPARLALRRRAPGQWASQTPQPTACRLGLSTNLRVGMLVHRCCALRGALPDPNNTATFQLPNFSVA